MSSRRLPLERGIVGEVDARLHRDRPRHAVGGDLRQRGGGVRDDPVRPREVVVRVRRVEDRAVDVVRVDVAARLRIEAGFRRRKRDPQHLVGIGRAGAAAARSSARQQRERRRAGARAARSCATAASRCRRRGSGFGVRRVALDDVAVAIDQELGEVPLDRLGAEQSGLRLLQVLVERRRVLAVDVDLGEQRKRDAVVDLAERLDLLLAAGLLRAELVAGKAEDLEPLAVQLLVERLEPLVLRRESALARRVDDQQRLALVLRSLTLLPWMSLTVKS